MSTLQELTEVYKLQDMQWQCRSKCQVKEGREMKKDLEASFVVFKKNPYSKDHKGHGEINSLFSHMLLKDQ